MIDLSDIKITRSKRRSLALHILPGGIIEVKAPNLIPKFLINSFIKKNEEWIEKRLSIAQKNITRTKKYIDGETFKYSGKEYALKIGDYTSIKIDGDRLLFPKALLFRAKKEIENWYIRQAREFITAQVKHYAQEMKTTYASISFSDTKSKWGSCTHDNRLQFNHRLIMAPHLVVRYVIIHELAHTTEKNHSHKFWSRVKAFNPSFKEQVKWIKQNGDSLRV